MPTSIAQNKIVVFSESRPKNKIAGTLKITVNILTIDLIFLEDSPILLDDNSIILNVDILNIIKKLEIAYFSKLDPLES